MTINPVSNYTQFQPVAQSQAQSSQQTQKSSSYDVQDRVTLSSTQSGDADHDGDSK